MFVFFEVQSLIFRSWDDCDISVIHSVLGVQQMSYSWISATMEREHGTVGRRTLILCRWRWSLLIGKETWSQHRLCVDRATSLCMVVSGHGHMRSGGQSSNYAEAMVGNGVVVWLTRTHCEMGMCVSFWRRQEVTLRDLQWTVTRMRWRTARRCVTPVKEVVRVVVTACDKMGMGVAMGAGWDLRLEPNVISINRPITSYKRRRQWFLTRMPWTDVKLLGGTEPLCRGCITL